ncbi:DNA-binding protein [Gemella sp. oral taxon 928]|uniref:ORF6N domain-containing protein n=1 Tax=Gemella sp. oral taxon 928 TaxID=1785995 RepID=UPI000767E082|nr:ORF6N domain-containing protein [Gemella sp. oral taxon 928]AME09545.1 DNA-binding protein [Gemella sp. oral taxon 928]
MIKTRWRLFGNLRKGMEKMDKKDEIMLVNQESLAEKIYIIRGQKVMLDFELAEIYGYETKRFNEQVKNNIEKFDDDFRFQLTKEEWENLRSKISTSKSETGSGGRRYLPYVFSEAGIYMLMTVLKGELAVKQSKALIRTFKQMKDYIVENQGLIGQREFLQLSMQITSNVVEMQGLRRDLMNVEDKVAGLVDNLGNVVHKSELSELILDLSNPQLKYGFLLLNGEPIEANLAYRDIYSIAKKSIYIVDNYIGVKTLVLLKDIPSSVEITIFSDNVGKGLHTLEYQDFCKEYPFRRVKFQKSGGEFHDRYIIIDWNTDKQRIYHCGASSKDAGQRITTISEVVDQVVYADLINKLLKNPILKLK